MSEAFAKAEVDAPRLMAEMLLEHVLGCDRLKLYTDPDRPASPAELTHLRELAKRALKHEPVQYLVGEAWFYGMKFACDARALVPRACTEVIVRRVVEDWGGKDGEIKRRRDGVGRDEETGGHGRDEDGCRGLSESSSEGHAEPGEPSATTTGADVVAPASSRSAGDSHCADAAEHSRGLRRRASSDHGTLGDHRPLIADVCAGSGCVGIALAKSLARARVVATDISGEALALVGENGERLGVGDRVELREGDLLAPLADLAGEVDYLVSNPPYIPDEEWAAVPPNVKEFEPELALRGGPDGLNLVRPILELGPGLLRVGGRIFVEVAASRAEQAAEVLAGVAGMRDVRVLKDQDGLMRVVEGVRA